MAKTWAEMVLEKRRADLRCVQARIVLMKSALDVLESIPPAIDGVADKAPGGEAAPIAGIVDVVDLINGVRAMRADIQTMLADLRKNCSADAAAAFSVVGSDGPELAVSGAPVANTHPNNIGFLTSLIAGEVFVAMADGCDVEVAAKRAAQAYRDGLDATYGGAQRGTAHLTHSISQALRKVALAVPEGTSSRVPPLLPESPALPPRDEEWRIEIKGDKFLFTRYVGGRPDEAYRSVNRDMASVFSAAVIQGFEPPPHLCWSDRPPAKAQKTPCDLPKT